MTEKLLQYIWQFQYFNTRNLHSTADEEIHVIQNGIYNTNQGPDFINARIRLGNTEWAGSIEMHVKASDWTLHKHTGDPNYRNVILHVVWEDDIRETLPFPTLALQSHVSNMLLEQYEALMQSPQFIPCQPHISNVPPLIITSWKERLLIERLQHRSVYIEKLLVSTRQHWEEVFWWMLARNFGVKINADSFEKIARTIPVNVLAKHKSQLIQLEAILMGQAALLDTTFEEDYPNMLRKEYNFLQKKYRLVKAHAPLYFLRMRPANFPSIRLAQLAMLIHESIHLFSVIRETVNVKEVEKLLGVTANDYWHYHYSFDEQTGFKPKVLGKQMIDNILINTVIPMLYAYGYLNAKEDMKQKALRWMEQVAAEKNSITKGFEGLNIENKTAFDSQALIQLKNEYCNYKHCLQCSVGNSILKNRVKAEE
ncbi:MAG: DUF2851 family protein [Chitinophagaceae bacterium]|nr:MAG: DUF2851 family protein [Chitinophagaceae bacterium]